MNSESTNTYALGYEIPMVMSVKDLSKILHIGKNCAYELVKSKAISSLKIGRNIRIPRSALEQYLNSIL